MALKSIDAVMIQKMFLSGAKALEAEKEYINELNVFPVPDGAPGFGRIPVYHKNKETAGKHTFRIRARLCPGRECDAVPVSVETVFRTADLRFRTG